MIQTKSLRSDPGARKKRGKGGGEVSRLIGHLYKGVLEKKMETTIGFTV